MSGQNERHPPLGSVQSIVRRVHQKDVGRAGRNIPQSRIQVRVTMIRVIIKACYPQWIPLRANRDCHIMNDPNACRLKLIDQTGGCPGFIIVPTQNGHHTVSGSDFGKLGGTQRYSAGRVVDEVAGNSDQVRVLSVTKLYDAGKHPGREPPVGVQIRQLEDPKSIQR
jgi:hypothetical protein